MSDRVLRVRSLGRVRYKDALAMQHALLRRSTDDYLLLLEHPHVYTLGVRALDTHVLSDPKQHGAELVSVDRGGDVTYHGPGQLVGYPIISLALGRGAIPGYVHRVEGLVIDALFDLGLVNTGRLEQFPGVWVDPGGDNPRKICAIGVRVSRGRTMHGFALNVDPDLSMFDHIVPCGIRDKAVTSLRGEGVAASMADVIDAVIARVANSLYQSTPPRIEVQRETPAGASSVPVRISSGARSLERRLAAAGVAPGAGLGLREPKPPWLRVEAKMGDDYLGLKRIVRGLELVTVCEEAGCPNIYECWADGTATFMINGERCTRACGFCLVDTRRPLALDLDEPSRVARAVRELDLAHVVVTAVARDDLPDGGAHAFVETIGQIRLHCPNTAVEVLIPDCKGDEGSLRAIFEARPEVLNHNLETVLRLQRAVRPLASYARSLSVLARAKAAGLTTKSGIILGMGETVEEILGALVDMAGVGVDIVTMGQYLRPSAAHLPVARYVAPGEFEQLASYARSLGFSHVEASPLTRSSYHARSAAAAVVGAGQLSERA